MFEALQDKLQKSGGPVPMLRSNPAVHYPFWYPPEWTTWFDEQAAWRDSTVLFDQSHHMTDVRFSGPDVRRLLSDTGVNSPANLGRNRAKQFVAVGYDGRFIGDAILFGLEDDVYSLVGTAANWVEFHATTGGYDVEVSRDDATLFNRTGQRRLWRYQLNGPRTQDIVEKAADATIEHIPFFRMGEFSIAGTPVRALNHTMSGVPGLEYTGLELWGPIEHGPRVLEALMAAGAEFGMRRGGALSYLSSAVESGWIAVPTPAVYSQDEMKPYREYLPAFGLEGALTIEGSFDSDDIQDYYHYPQDLGYDRLIKYDHDFIGRSALEALTDAPHRSKVWLHWNSEDVARVLRDGLFGEADQSPRIMCFPLLRPVTLHYDTVLKSDRLVGLSNYGGYTVNIREVVSLAMIDEAEAQDGDEVEIVWGEPERHQCRPFIGAPHVQTTVRATIRTRPPV